MLTLQRGPLLSCVIAVLISMKLANANSAPPSSTSSPKVNPSQAVAYLRKFGHAPQPDPMSGDLMSADSLRDSIKSFQRFANLPMTGSLDDLTLEKMAGKRCGNSDIAGTENMRRKKRYTAQGQSWDKTDLTYRIENTTPDLSTTQVENEIRQAFKWWEDASPLTFTRVPRHEHADIRISFGSRYHGDGDPFDGQGQTLAHAYFPGTGIGGDAHFDEDETWTIETTSGVNLRIVAAHEFGHSLGLSHSDIHQALMAPFYNSHSTGLHQDDIRGIQHLYGRPGRTTTTQRTISTISTTSTRSTRPTTTTTTTTRTPPVGTCNGRFDAMTQFPNGSTYGFLGKQFWRLSGNGVDEGFPMETKRVWGVRGRIDAALTRSTYTDLFQCPPNSYLECAMPPPNANPGSLVLSTAGQKLPRCDLCQKLITGHKVYRFVNGRLQRGYPLHVSTVYSGMPSHINAAFEWSGNGKVYFMKGDQYWRYNPSTRSADPGYPRSMSVWKGLPNEVDAALQYDGRTYFFRNGHYYKFNDDSIQVAESREYPYPRRTDQWWLGCMDNTLRNKDDEGDGKHVGGDENSSGLRAINSPLILLSAIVVSYIASLQT